MNLHLMWLTLQQHTTFCLVMGGVLGLVLGSFLNVVILRIPARMMNEWRQEAHEVLELPMPEEAEADQTPGIEAHSRCPGCKTPIRWRDNIPVLSYLLLRGKCRACGMRISLQYPLVELISALIGLGLTAYLGVGIPLLLGSFLFLMLLTLAVIDGRTMLLPDGLVYSVLWVGLLASALQWPHMPSLPHAVFGAVAGWLSLWGMFWLFKLIRGREGLGYGDFKLFAALGAWCGIAGLIPIMVIATGTALLGALLWWLARRDAWGPFPFGPALAIGGAVQWLFPTWFTQVLQMWVNALH